MLCNNMFIILKYNTIIQNKISYLFRLIINITEVNIINKQNKRQSILLRYYFIKILDSIVKYLKYLQYKYLKPITSVIEIIEDKVDINIKLIQIKKIYITGERSMIFNKINNVKGLINKMESYKKYDNKLNSRIFIDFILKYDSDEEISIIDHIEKYKDYEQNLCHTLKNILLFENINISNNNAHLIIKYYNKNKKLCSIDPLKLEYKDIKNEHINYFNKI